MKDRFERAIAIFRENNSMMRTGDAISAGIHPVSIYSMRQRGIIEQISRGLYRLTDGAVHINPDIVAVSMKIPVGVICLISALSFYELTLQIPHEVSVALLNGAEQPRLEYPPVRIFRFTGGML